MKPAPFKYYAPTTIPEVLDLLSQYAEDAKLLAGGQSLIPTMNFRLAQPSVLIDLNHVSELFGITEMGNSVRINAMTRQAAVERSDIVRSKLPLVTETMPYIAHIQIRNRGTFGGSIAHADPAAELPAVAVSRNARFKVQSTDGVRWISADECYISLFETSFRDDELLIEVEFPTMAARSGAAFAEVARRHGDYAIVGCSGVIELNEQGAIVDARVVYLGIGEGPVSALQAASVLIGQQPSPELFAEAADVAATRDTDPPSDIHASSAYRQHLVRQLFQQVVSKAVSRAH